MAWWRRATACENAGQWISVRLDGELTELEAAALDRHLERCERCNAYAAELGSMTHLLRAAPLVVRPALSVQRANTDEEAHAPERHKRQRGQAERHQGRRHRRRLHRRAAGDLLGTPHRGP